MTFTNARNNGTAIIFSPADLYLSTNSSYGPLTNEMLDAELDSDPQMSDSELSWQSVTDVDSLTATNHWRGWKQQTNGSLPAITHARNASPLTNTLPLGNFSFTPASEGQIERRSSLIHRTVWFRSYSDIGRSER